MECGCPDSRRVTLLSSQRSSGDCQGAAMALVACYECGKQVSTLAQHCPQCGAPGRAAESASAAPEQPASPEPLSAETDKPRPIPWYRRSTVNTVFILIGMGTQGVLPLTLVTCVLLLTGDIYYKTAPSAVPKVWGKANKYAAAFILAASIAWLIYLATALPLPIVAARTAPVAARRPVPIEAPAVHKPNLTDTSLLPTRDTVADKLTATAAKFNATAPVMVDKETRLDSVIANGRTFVLNYTIVDRSSVTMTTEQIAKGQRKLIQRACEGKLARWIAEGVTMRLRYSSSYGIELVAEDINTLRCETLKANH
jgi:hypothetical protein